MTAISRFITFHARPGRRILHPDHRAARWAEHNVFYKHEPGRGSFPQSSYAPGPVGPATSLEYYWGDIGTGAYAKAWTYLSATVESEAAFVDGEKKARPTNIELLGTLAGISGNHATIVVNRLITHDQQYGCRSWSGHYSMVRAGGHWLVASAQITPKAC
jgi:hypothetical protein